MQTFLCLMIALALAPQAPSQGTKPSSPPKLAAAVAAALPRTGIAFKKLAEAVWVITVKIDGVDLEVAARATDHAVILEALVEERPALSQDVLRQLLNINYDANFAKLGLDTNGDLFSVTELPPDFSVPALKRAIEEVARLALAGADSVSPSTTAKAEQLPPVAPAKGATLPILRGAFEMTYDPLKWRQQKVDEPGVVQFVHRSGEAYIKVIADRNQVSPDGLRSVVLENARNASPEITLVYETPRTINGLPVRVMRYSGENKGFKFTFYNQIFADASGNVQLAAWTGTNLFDEYRADFLELFAGFRRVQR